MFKEYSNLNQYSADRFYRQVLKSGLKVVKAQIISHDLDLSQAPSDLQFSELMICGTKMLLKKN